MTYQCKARTLAAAVALSFMAAAASAGTISKQYSGNSLSVFGGPTTSDRKYRSATINDDVKGALGTAAGAFYLRDDDGILGNGTMADFIAFCVDIFNTLALPTEYSVTNTPFSGTGQPGTFDAGQKSRVQSLFDNNYAGLDFDSNDEVAGFQVAIWESLFEESGTLDVKGGDFTVSWAAGDAATTAANTFLAAGDDGKTNYRLTWLQSTSGGQNLVTVSPVPLPAAGLLFLSALGGLAALRRRKRAA